MAKLQKESHKLMHNLTNHMHISQAAMLLLKWEKEQSPVGYGRKHLPCISKCTKNARFSQHQVLHSWWVCQKQQPVGCQVGIHLVCHYQTPGILNNMPAEETIGRPVTAARKCPFTLESQGHVRCYSSAPSKPTLWSIDVANIQTEIPPPVTHFLCGCQQVPTLQVCSSCDMKANDTYLSGLLWDDKIIHVEQLEVQGKRMMMVVMMMTTGHWLTAGAGNIPRILQISYILKHKSLTIQ